jgi:hypothetical protein
MGLRPRRKARRSVSRNREIAQGNFYEPLSTAGHLTSLKVVQALTPIQGVKNDICSLLHAGGIAFCDSGRTLIAGNSVRVVERVKVPYRINVWNVQDGKLNRQIALEQVIPWSIAVSPDGRSLAARLETGGQTRLEVWTMVNE